MSNEVDIKISETGSKVVIRDFGNLAKASDKAETSVKALKATLDTLKGFSLKNLITQSNNLATALGSLNKGAAELNSLKNALTGLANSGTQLNKLKTTLDGFGNSTSGLGVLYNTLKSLATTSNNLVRLNQHLAALPPLIAHIQALSAAIATLVSHNAALSTLATNLRNVVANNTGITALRNAISALSSSMATLTTQSNAIIRALQGMQNASGRTSTSLWNMRSSLLGISGLLVAQKVRDWIDAWASVSGLIQIATDSFAESTLVQEKLFSVTQNIRSPLEETAQLYARINRVSDSLGASQNQAIKFTEGVGKALAIQHSRVGEVTGGLIQLAQALGSGIVRSQEFRSINDSLPVVMRTVAKNMEGGALSVSQLRRRMLEGKLTSQEFFQAFLKGSSELNKDFEESGYTISQAFSILNNDMIKFIGQLNKATGFSDGLAKSFKFLGENLAILGSIGLFALITWLGGLTAAFMASTTAIGILSAAVALFNRVVLLNPTVFLIASLATLTLAMYSFKDSMELGTSGIAKFGKKSIEVKATFGDFLKLVVRDTKDYLGAAMMVFGDFFDAINEKTKAPVKKSGKEKGLFDFDETGILNTLLKIGRVFDLAAASIRLGFLKIGIDFELLVSNPIIRGFNKVQRLVTKGTNLFTKEQYETPEVKEYTAENAKTDFLKGQDSIFKDLTDTTTNNVVNGLLREAAEAQQNAIARELAIQKALADMDKKGTPDPVSDKNEELQKIKREYEQILNKVDLIGAAELKQKKELEFIKANKIALKLSDEKVKDISAKIVEHYKDAIDPLGKMTREYNEQLKLLKMMPQQRREELEVMRQIEELRKGGKEASPAEKEQFRKNAKDKIYEEDVGGIRDDVVESYRKKRQEPLLTEKAYTDVLQDPNGKDAKKAILDKEMQANPDMFKGTQEQMDAQAQSWEMMYRKIDFLRQHDVISEQTAAYQKSLIDKEIREQKLKGTRDLFDGLATLQDSGSKTAFRIGKAASIANATMNMYDAISAAYKAPPGWPLNAPSVIGVTVAQASNLAKIRSVGFMTGGSFDVTGSGGHDSQTVAFRASPGERVSVQTPQQYRKGDPNGNGNGGQQKAPENNIRVVNLLDPAIVGDYMATPDGEKVFINMIQRNQAQIRQLVR
jgi:tape measure domain-containing protein